MSQNNTGTMTSDKWISCEDRLPDDKMRVVVKRKADGKEKNATYYDGKNFIFNKPGFAVRLSSDKNYKRRKQRAEATHKYEPDMIDAVAASKFYTTKEVTHWKPLTPTTH